MTPQIGQNDVPERGFHDFRGSKTQIPGGRIRGGQMPGFKTTQKVNFRG